MKVKSENKPYIEAVCRSKPRMTPSGEELFEQAALINAGDEYWIASCTGLEEKDYWEVGQVWNKSERYVKYKISKKEWDWKYWREAQACLVKDEGGEV